jgi:hypothetical protein
MWGRGLDGGIMVDAVNHVELFWPVWMGKQDKTNASANKANGSGQAMGDGYAP